MKFGPYKTFYYVLVENSQNHNLDILLVQNSSKFKFLAQEFEQTWKIDHLVLGHCSSTTKQVVVVICVLPPYYFAWPQNENRKAASASSLSLYFEAV